MWSLCVCVCVCVCVRVCVFVCLIVPGPIACVYCTAYEPYLSYLNVCVCVCVFV